MPNTDSIILTKDSVVPEPFTALFLHWIEASSGRWAPAWRDFSLEKVGSRLLPWTIVVDIETDPEDYYYRFWGTERTNLIGHEMSRKRLSEIPDDFMREANRQEYQNICKIKKPLLCDTPVTTASGRHAVFQSIRLPISDGGEDVRHVVSAVDFQKLNNQHYEYFGTDPKFR